jgi:hypothetical protein
MVAVVITICAGTVIEHGLGLGGLSDGFLVTKSAHNAAANVELLSPANLTFSCDFLPPCSKR